MSYSQALEMVRDSDSADSVKCAIYAKIAEKEGRADAARFFRVLAYSKLVHTRQCMTMNGEMGRTDKNLENYAHTESENKKRLMDQLLDQAAGADEQAKRDLLALFAEVQALYINYAERAMRDYSFLNNDYSVCDYCGLIVTGKPPFVCPVCQADNAFVKVS